MIHSNVFAAFIFPGEHRDSALAEVESSARSAERMYCPRRATALNRTLCGLIALLCVLVLSGCGLQRIQVPGFLGSSNIGNRVVAQAKTQIGRAYRYGGSSPSAGFDCSGLIWWAYRQHGVRIPRVTTDQAKIGRSVNLAQAQAGDILVFRIGGRGTGLHTALYTGGGTFIHSPSSGKRVRLDKVNNSYWRKKLRTIRRP